MDCPILVWCLFTNREMTQEVSTGKSSHPGCAEVLTLVVGFARSLHFCRSTPNASMFYANAFHMPPFKTLRTILRR